MISALVLLAAVGFTLVAAYQWAGRLGALMWQEGSWRCEIGKATFGKAMSGTPYSPSSSGWFGFTANTRWLNAAHGNQRLYICGVGQC